MAWSSPVYSVNASAFVIYLGDFDGVVIGVSAGPMNCASIVYAQPEKERESLDPNFRRFMPGLELTEIMLLTHYQKVKDTILDERGLYADITYPDSFGHSFIAIPDGSYVVVNGEGARLFGEGYRISKGQIHTICEKEENIEI